MKKVSRLAAFIETHIPVKELKQAGFFQSKDPGQGNYIKNLRDYERISARVKHFFGLKSIYDYAKLEPFGPGVKSESEKSVEFVTAKEWITDDNRLLNLLENN